jgi:hypothetical protein
VTDAALALPLRAGFTQQAGRMYPATDHLPDDAEHDDVDWYVRKFRLETAEADAPLEVPEVRSRKWLVVVAVLVIGLSGLLALATFAVSGPH